MEPENYKQFKDFHLDILYKNIKSHIVEWSLDMQLCKVTFTAIEIGEKELPADFFKIPNGFPMKKS